ncbi:hypothetical protein TB2_006869 [Malus domestica]
MAKNTVKRVTYLHGDLDLTIVEARHLPNMDIVSDCFRRCFTTCDTRVQHLCKDPKTDSTTGDAAAPATAIENKMRRLGYPCRSQKKRSATLALRGLRFGLPGPTVVGDEDAKKKARLAQFAPNAKPDAKTDPKEEEYTLFESSNTSNGGDVQKQLEVSWKLVCEIKTHRMVVLSMCLMGAIESDLLGSDTSGVAQGGASSELDLRNISKLILPLLGASNYNQTPIQLNGWIVSPMDSRYRRYSLTLHEKHS